MIAGAPGASGSLVILSSSGETGWKPIPALAGRVANIPTASPATAHLPNRNIVISPKVNACSTDVSKSKTRCRRKPRNPGGQGRASRAPTHSAPSSVRAPAHHDPDLMLTADYNPET